MQVIVPSSEQTCLIMQALYAVASAEGTIPISAFHIECIEAIARHLMGGAAPVSPDQLVLPSTLPMLVTTEDMRRSVIRLLTIMPFIDRRVSAAKADVVSRAAAMLGIQDNGLIILRQAVRRQHIRLTMGILSRSIRTFWSSDGKARWKDWADMILVMLPMLMRGRQELREKYQALRHYTPGTLGNVLYNYYRSNGFAMPGERGGFPEKFVLHEFYHIFGSYPVNHQGEMLAAAFTGGNVEALCMDMILLSLLQYQVGVRVAGFTPGMPGQLKPDEFFHAISRGSAMRVNLMEGWNFWDHADRSLVELRQEYGLPPLHGKESFEPLLVKSLEAA